MAVVIGGKGNDDLEGTSGKDIIVSGRGDDVIDAGDGNDIVISGSGNDTVVAGDGNDLVLAGKGDDTVDGGEGDDLLLGGKGDDTLTGGAGSDHVSGGKGDDVLIYVAADNAPEDEDYYDGGKGLDTLRIVLTLDTFADADIQAEIDAAQAFFADPANRGKVFSFALLGNLSAKNIENIEIVVDGGNAIGGDDTSEEISSTSANDTILAGGGDDVITYVSGDGNDVVDGGDGNDRFKIIEDPGSDSTYEVSQNANGQVVVVERDSAGNILSQQILQNIETLEINTGDGDDTVIVNDLSNTDISTTVVPELSTYSEPLAKGSC